MSKLFESSDITELTLQIDSSNIFAWNHVQTILICLHTYLDFLSDFYHSLIVDYNIR